MTGIDVLSLHQRTVAVCLSLGLNSLPTTVCPIWINTQNEYRWYDL